MERIGQIEGDGILRIDAARLVDTRVLIQGSSGSGKSWLIRLLIEKVAAKIPVLILDLEGEFVTLREHFDFVVAGEGGEVSVDVRSAGLLARKLLELKLSGVVSLYDLDRPQRRAYVRHFLESIMAAPRHLWAPRLIVLDEAHEFAPEGGKAESLGAVIDVASRGRKRGFCLVAATQRMSKLDKDVVAECRNVFVGQTTLDVDVKRALDTLGFPADLEHKRDLRSLDHQFYAMGPATSAEGVVLFKADPVKTTHPESGLRRSLSPPEPSKRIKQALGELTDLPKQAEEEAKTMAEAKRQIADLQRQLNAKPRPVPVIDEEATKRLIAKEVADRDKFWKAEMAKAEKAHGSLAKRLRSVKPLAESLIQLSTLNGDATIAVSAPPKIIDTVAPKISGQQLSPTRPAPSARAIRQDQSPDSSELKKPQQRILNALAWWESIGESSPSRYQLGMVANVNATGGYFDNMVGPLSAAGYVDRGSGTVSITESGRALAVAPEGINTLDEYHEKIRRQLKKAPVIRLFDALIANGGEPMSREELGNAAGVNPTGGYFDNMVGPLGTLQLVERRSGKVIPTALMFPEGLS